MREINNYEIAVSQIGEGETAVPILALTFNLSDVGEGMELHWDEHNTTLEIAQHAIVFSFEETQLAFPLLSHPMARPVAGSPLDRPTVMKLISTVESLFICAYDSQGNIAQHQAFAMRTAH